MRAVCPCAFVQSPRRRAAAKLPDVVGRAWTPRPPGAFRNSVKQWPISYEGRNAKSAPFTKMDETCGVVAQVLRLRLAGMQGKLTGYDASTH